MQAAGLLGSVLVGHLKKSSPPLLEKPAFRKFIYLIVGFTYRMRNIDSLVKIGRSG